MLTQRAGFAGEGGKDLLGDVPGQMGVPADLPQRGRKNEFHVPVDQGGERLLRTVRDVGGEQCGVIRGLDSHGNCRRTEKRTKKTGSLVKIHRPGRLRPSLTRGAP